ncbi:hypothetical protein ACEUZ9_000916 [Paracoccus litorisediminis]|uniref:hypothetical protein n=1 Tax=Paracoccus litorisediminis TaxID=2006130 RepID=UPI00372F0386
MQDFSQRVVVSQRATQRLMALTIDLRNILLDAIPGRPQSDVEAAQLRMVADLMPEADHMMRLAFFRLLTGFVRDPVELMRHLTSRHSDVLANYAWFLPESKEDRREAERLGMREGASVFWLMQGRNPALDELEFGMRPQMVPYFFENQWQSLAMRAWLRLQALHFDMDRTDLIKSIWAMSWADREIPREYHPPVPRNPVPECGSAETTVTESAKPRLH